MGKGEGEKALSATQAIEESYQKEIFDEFVLPTLICNGDEPIATISENDSVIFFNYRPDRLRQLASIFTNKDYESFERKCKC